MTSPRSMTTLRCRRSCGACCRYPPTSLSQLVMWRVASGLDWNTIAQLSENWANRYELTLAKDFVNRLDTLPEGETGRLVFQVASTDETTRPIALELTKVLDGKNMLGLVTQVIHEIGARPERPAIACRVRLNAGEASVQVMSSDAAAQHWVPFGKFSLPVAKGEEKFDAKHFSAALTEGVLNRLVRAQVTEGTVQDKGKRLYQVRIEPRHRSFSTACGCWERIATRKRHPKNCWESRCRRAEA